MAVIYMKYPEFWNLKLTATLHIWGFKMRSKIDLTDKEKIYEQMYKQIYKQMFNLRVFKN